MMSDSWTAPLFTGNRWIYGAAAREARIKAFGGVDNIVKAAGAAGGEYAARIVLDMATRTAEPPDDAKVVPLRKRA